MRSALRLIPRQPIRPVKSNLARSFTTGSTLRLKEDKSQDPQEIEQAKQEQLKTGKKKEELESQSETGVKADREKVHDHSEHMKDLQKQTAQQTQKEHPHGKS